MGDHPSGRYVGTAAIAGITVLGSIALATGMDGALLSTLSTAILGVLIIIVLRRTPA